MCVQMSNLNINHLSQIQKIFKLKNIFANKVLSNLWREDACSAFEFELTA